jgi:hypothetical protein
MNLLESSEITINGISFDIKKNVKDVLIDVNTGNKQYSFHDGPIIGNKPNVYFLFETPFHEAFGHWVFESAIFLPFVKHFIDNDRFFLLVNKNNERKYKKSFFKLFNISDANIHYINNSHIHTCDVSYRDIPDNNISIVCNNFILNQIPSSLNESSIEKIKYLLNRFYETTSTGINNDKQTENLLLPRSKVENYLPNDRQISYDLIYQLLKDKEYISYDTQETDNFSEQILLIQQSTNIYTYWGSSFIVNGFFSRNSNIYVIMDCNIDYNYHHNKYTICNIIKSIIETNNNIYLLQ